VAVSISFAVLPRADLQVPEVVPVIDGRLLTDLAHEFEQARAYGPPNAYGGLIPAFFAFAPAAEHYGPSDKPVALLGCGGCGEWGCWPLTARIAGSGSTIGWSNFAQPHRKDRRLLGPRTIRV
jgi:hypothetical protein